MRVFELRGGRHAKVSGCAEVRGLGLRLDLWEGEYLGKHARWLRWHDFQGNLLPTGGESTEQEKRRAEQAAQEADQFKREAQQEKQRAEKLAAKLMELGLSEDDLT